MVPVTIGFKAGTTREFQDGLPAIEDKVRELAEIGVDLIGPGGGPPLMVHGYAGERTMLTKWEDTYGIPVVSTGVTQIKAMRALGARKIAGIAYFSGSINQFFTDYFTDAGFQVLAMAGMDVPFDRVETLETDLGVAVLHTVPARVWSTQKSFDVGQRTTGYGRLLAELPDDPG